MTEFFAYVAVALLAGLILTAIVVFLEADWEAVVVYLGCLAIVLFGLWGIGYLVLGTP
jgi:hypothetical protein